MERGSHYKTINTFSRRPCCNQVLSYVVILAQNISFWGLVQGNFINQNTRHIMVGLFSVQTLTLVILAMLVSASDPSDPVMMRYKNGDSSAATSIGSPCLFCEHCQSYVLVTSRHCKACDRCVEKFDHHCIWVNNCIGRSNYRLFMAMIIATFSNMLTYLVSVVLLWKQNDWKSFLAQMVITWGLSIWILVLFILIFALIVLHLFLISQGLTTFDYILNKRNAQISPVPLQTISSSHINEPNTQENALANLPVIKRESQLQSRENQSQQNHRTQNQFAHPPHSAFQNIQNQQRQSDFQSFDHMKSTHNRLPEKQTQKMQQENNSDINQGVDTTRFDQFYKKHRGLKLLVGPAIIVKPKRSQSAKLIKKSSLRSSKLKEVDDIYIENMGIERGSQNIASVKVNEKK